MRDVCVVAPRLPGELPRIHNFFILLKWSKLSGNRNRVKGTMEIWRRNPAGGLTLCQRASSVTAPAFRRSQSTECGPQPCASGSVVHRQRLEATSSPQTKTTWERRQSEYNKKWPGACEPIRRHHETILGAKATEMHGVKRSISTEEASGTRRVLPRQARDIERDSYKRARSLRLPVL